MWKRRFYRLVILLLGAVNVTRAIIAFRADAALDQAQFTLPLSWVGAVYLLLGLGWVAILVVSWNSRHRYGLAIAGIVYQVVLWSLRLWGQTSGYSRNLWIWNIIGTFVFIGVIIGIERLALSAPSRIHR